MGDADEFAVVDSFDGVAGRADLAVDLEAAAEGGAVVGGEEAEVGPGVGWGVEDVVVALGGGGGEEEGGGGGGGQGEALVVFGELRDKEKGGQHRQRTQH